MTDRLICRQHRAAPAPTVGLLHRLLGADIIRSSDREDGGPYSVAGTIGIDSTPDIMVRRKVRLICWKSGRLVRETWSEKTTGEYRFDHVRKGPWIVLAHDYTGTYNAVVADNKLGELL